MTAYDVVTDALRSAGLKVTESSGGARSQCPAHGSRGLSLAVRPNPKNPDGPVHVTCFAGCETEDVLAQIGLGLRDLYDGPRTVQRVEQFRPRRKPTPWDGLDIDHIAARIVQQERLDAGPPYPDPAESPSDRVDAAWALHVRRAAAPEYGLGGGDGYGQWSTGRAAEFARYRAEVDARGGR